MIGLLFFGAIGLWLAIAIALSIWASKLAPPSWRWAVGLVLAPLIIVMPVVDELIGLKQFEELCKPENIALKIDAEKIRGKAVITKYKPAELIEALIPIKIQTLTYLDPVSYEELASFKTVRAEPGWFFRKLGMSPGHSCNGLKQGSGSRDIEKEFKFTVIETPLQK